jgi:hypothetical protein
MSEESSKNEINRFQLFPTVMLESNDVIDIPVMQFALFIHGIDIDFNTTEELPALMGE